MSNAVHHHEEWHEEKRRLVASHLTAVNAPKSVQTLFYLLRGDREMPFESKLEWSQLLAVSDDREHLAMADSQGVTLLHLAAASGNLFVAQELVDLGILDVDVEDAFGRTPLHEAVAHGHQLVVQQLLMFGANLFHLTKNKQTVLHTAARYDQAPMLYYLLLLSEDEADENFMVSDFQDALGKHTAHQRLAEALRHHKIKKHELLELAHKTTRDRALEESELQRSGNTKSRGGLGLAPCPCRSGLRWEACHGSALISTDLRVKALSQTSLRHDIARDILKELTDNGGVDGYVEILPRASQLTVGQQLFRDSCDDDRRTALHLAAMWDRDRAAKLLMDIGCDPAIRDRHSMIPLQFMIRNMPSVAAEALVGLTQIDRPARKIHNFIGYLEPLPLDEQRRTAEISGSAMTETKYTATILEEISLHSRIGLVGSDAVGALVAKKWDDFGRRGVWQQIVLYLIFLALWTTITLATYADDRLTYTRSSYWRIGVEVAGVVTWLYFITEELREIYGTVKRQSGWRHQECAAIDQELKTINEAWNDAHFLKTIKHKVHSSSSLTAYMADTWNYLDWISYLLLLVPIVTQIEGALTQKGSSGTSVTVDEKINARFLVIALIFSWMKILKFARAFPTFGPFVVMLGHMAGDTLRFLLLFVDLVIPFSVAFHALFGKVLPEYQDLGVSIVSVFRMTVIDLDYAALVAVDPIMAPILVVVWIFISGILFINLFIAMMSNTFQIVSDNAKSVSAMQRLKSVLSVEATLSKAALQRHRVAVFNKGRSHINEYDDPDDEETSLLRLRLEILEAVNHHGRTSERIDATLSETVALLRQLTDHVQQQQEEQQQQQADQQKSTTAGTMGAPVTARRVSRRRRSGQMNQLPVLRTNSKTTPRYSFGAALGPAKRMTPPAPPLMPRTASGTARIERQITQPIIEVADDHLVSGPAAADVSAAAAEAPGAADDLRAPATGKSPLRLSSLRGIDHRQPQLRAQSSPNATTLPASPLPPLRTMPGAPAATRPSRRDVEDPLMSHMSES